MTQVLTDVQKAIDRHGEDLKGDRLPDPPADGKKSLDAAKEYAGQIKSSMFSDRSAPKS
jgi:hypothetical protein